MFQPTQKAARLNSGVLLVTVIGGTSWVFSLKPNTISFGQQLREEDLEKAERFARQSDLVIAAGSTLQVQPAASFPLIAKESGAKLVIITLSETPLDRYADLVFQEKLGPFFDRLNY